MSRAYEQLMDKLLAYKRKYYKNKLLKGIILSSALLINAFVMVNLLEYFGNFTSPIRATLFFSFLGLSALSAYFWILIPIFKLTNPQRFLPHQEAADQIGKYFPEVSDKLLNLLQLNNLTSQQSDLLAASIDQKAKKISVVHFPDAIHYSENRRYARYLIPPFLLAMGLLIFIPQFFTQTTPRLLRYNESFAPKAPFEFVLKNKELSVFKNEDAELVLEMKGKNIPENVFLNHSAGRKIRLERQANGTYSYTFKQVQKNIDFHFEAAGFESAKYEMLLLERPSLNNFSAELTFPTYLNRKPENLSNIGNLIVPAGTKIRWYFDAQKTKEVQLLFNGKIENTQAKDKLFVFEKNALESQNYEVILKNEHSNNKEKISYLLNVIPDEYPNVSLKQYQDTTLYNYLLIGGNVADDYGISRLQLHYRVRNPKNDLSSDYKTLPIKIESGLINQSYYQQIELANFGIKQGEILEYYVQVWDNDGIKGAKSSKTGVFTFNLPNQEAFEKELEAAAAKSEKEMEKTLKDAQKIQKDLDALQDKLKSKQQLSWQEKKMLEDLLRQKENLTKEIQQLKENFEKLNEKTTRFSPEEEKIAKKVAQLDQMMEDLLDEETQKLYDELQKLLEQNRLLPDELQEILEQIEEKEDNLENELDRNLELFKKLQFDRQKEELVKQLEQLSQEQENLAKNTEKNAEKTQKESAENQKNQDLQEELNKKTEQAEEKTKEVEKTNQELEEKQKLPENLSQKMEQVKKEQEKAQEKMKENKPKEAAQKQKEAAEQMKKLAEEMEEKQSEEEKKQRMEDYNALRQILENLLKLSFEQESLMKNLQNIRPEDPRLVPLGQVQLKLKDDAKIVEDSLLALSKRVFEMKTFVTREVGDLNGYMDEALEEIRKRNAQLAAAKQQFVMTASNNLALMLDELMHQMQDQMQGQGKGDQESLQIMNSKRKQNLSKMQEELGQELEGVQKGNEKGKSLSQKLAKMAAKQALIRKLLQEKMKGKKGGKQKGGKEGGDGSPEMLDEMEKIEEDIVNKRVTQETINRQKQIVTRLLESEKAEREQEMSPERESERAKDKTRKNPAEFSEYLKLKEKQIELLKTIPPSLNPYYKKEVNEYFKKMD